MTKLEAVNTFYSAQLSDLSLIPSETGMVSFQKDDELKPLTIGGKRVVITTKQMLKEADWEHRVAFHPLSEQASVELSPVLNAFKNYVTVSLSTKIGSTLQLIANFAIDPVRHKGSNKKIGDVLKNLVGFDEKSAGIVKNIIKASSNAPEKRLINILLKNSEGTYLRSCIITYPILEALETAVEQGKTEFFGMKGLRNNDLELVLKLFRYVCGDKFIAGSNDRTAPYYESLLLAWHKTAAHFNSIHDTWKTKLPEFKEAIKAYELEWGEQLIEGFAVFAEKHHSVAPPLPGNRPIVDEVAVDEILDRQKKAFETDLVTLEEPKSSSVPKSNGRSLSDFTSRESRDEPRYSENERDRGRYARREEPRRDRGSRFELSRGRGDSPFTKSRSIKDF